MPALLLPNEILAISSQAADRLIETGDGDCMMLYVALVREGSDVKKAQRMLHWEDARVSAVYRRLVKLGLAAEEEAPAPTAKKAPTEELPDYSREDIRNAMENEAEFRGLYLEVERLLGKHLSPSDLNDLYKIYDGIALSAEVILLLVSYMIRTVRRQKQSEGAIPRMREILNKASYWKRLGLESVELVEEYLQQQELVDQREWAILSAVGVLQPRPAVEKEREFINRWVQYGFSNELITMAYEDTIYRKGQMNWPYVNKILLNWHEQGWKTPDQVKEGRKQAKRAATAGKKKKEDYQPSDERIQKNAERLKQLLGE